MTTASSDSKVTAAPPRGSAIGSPGPITVEGGLKNRIGISGGAGTGWPSATKFLPMPMTTPGTTGACKRTSPIANARPVRRCGAHAGASSSTTAPASSRPYQTSTPSGGAKRTALTRLP
jgi:hypothetical protein